MLVILDTSRSPYIYSCSNWEAKLNGKPEMHFTKSRNSRSHATDLCRSFQSLHSRSLELLKLWVPLNAITETH
uniref:Uncharacterized protein n=1 Tax=Pararge aegeria TaxID=116150 RepID=S4PVU1_9NEOP